MSVQRPTLPSFSPSFLRRVRRLFVGKALTLDAHIFHRLSLTALLAWVGLGSDGLSSSCYGPEEAFLALGAHSRLAVYLAIATTATVFIISISYSQIIELFPTGGGGYLVASKLLSPNLGVVSGSALLVDYVLTITISIASGADAIFSLLPLEWHRLKLTFAVGALLVLLLMNLRGVRESVAPLLPVFAVFLLIHAFGIVYSLVTKADRVPAVFAEAHAEAGETIRAVGWFGFLLLLFKAFSVGGGTFTGIEAVSNGLPILREPRVTTGRRTMRYMATSLAFTAGGLIFVYLLYQLQHAEGKTLNASLFETITAHWDPTIGRTLVLVALVSEALLLFIAAQTGFLDGPRVMANMAMDYWIPSRYALLSERFVVQNGILTMGVASLIMMVLSRGSVKLLVVLYSINVFLSFSLSQLGMVRHWWRSRRMERRWRRKLATNGVGFVITSAILIAVSIIKFHEGGWITIVVTGSVVLLAFYIKQHYSDVRESLQRLDDDVLPAVEQEMQLPAKTAPVESDLSGMTGVFLVNGFTGAGIHTVTFAMHMFDDKIRNFVFLQVGLMDAGRFKGADELTNLQQSIADQTGRYVALMNHGGYYAEAHASVGVDIVEEMDRMVGVLSERYPNAVFFAGQLMFPGDSAMARILHNYTAFAIQRRLYLRGISLIVLPVRLPFSNGPSDAPSSG